MEFTITTQFLDGVELQLQTPTFQAWFNEHCMPKIDFADTCVKRDEWNRPSEWLVENITVKEVYFTENENYNFNKFLIYGTV